MKQILKPMVINSILSSRHSSIKYIVYDLNEQDSIRTNTSDSRLVIYNHFFTNVIRHQRKTLQ